MGTGEADSLLSPPASLSSSTSSSFPLGTTSNGILPLCSTCHDHVCEGDSDGIGRNIPELISRQSCVIRSSVDARLLICQVHCRMWKLAASTVRLPESYSGSANKICKLDTTCPRPFLLCCAAGPGTTYPTQWDGTIQ